MPVTINGSGPVAGATTLNGLTIPTVGFGKVLQVVQGSTATETLTSSSTYSSTNLSASITPSSSTSKVLVIVVQAGVGKDTGNTSVDLRLQRGSTVISDFGFGIAGNGGTASNTAGSQMCVHLDSPATSSATTYSTQFRSRSNVAQAYVQLGSAVSTITLVEVAA